MSLRTKILAYLVLIHLVLGGLAFFALIDRPWLLVVAEILFVVSAIAGYLLVRAFFVPLQLIRTGSELMRERDFSSRFREVGQSEMDALIGIYNRMIDELREERLKLEEQDLFLDKVLEASPTAVITLDHDERISQLNAAATRLCGGERQELLGRGIEVFPFPLGATMQDLREGGSAVITFQGRRRLRCRQVSFYDRGFARRVYLVEELTEELQASERAAYDKLIRMMSHEVNNSVGAVRSLLESCQSYGSQLRAADRSDYDQALAVAAERLLHLNSFMNGLAEVVRVPAPDRRPCDLPRLLGDIALLVQPELEQRAIRLVWRPPGSFPELSLDKNQMEQVLVNVLRNAMEAIGYGGTVTVSLSANGRRPCLAVHDTGPGVAPEAEPHLFTPFYSTKARGRGIGLTLIREILTAHDLDFDLRNVDPRGAEFRILF